MAFLLIFRSLLKALNFFVNVTEPLKATKAVNLSGLHSAREIYHQQTSLQKKWQKIEKKSSA
jgi:bifunctional pyridoxal-dependent enzyme with beta-cystathionase and maltose regulon repressor activities